MTRDISNSEDILDSRDIIARIEELEELETTFNDAAQELADMEDDADGQADAVEALDAAREAFDEDAQTELKVLRELAEECEGYASDWRHGETLIRDSYFERYAQELAEDIGLIKDDAAWPYTCIDWERAARELQMDYTAVEFDGVTYWVR